jgi:hypothetical protein
MLAIIAYYIDEQYTIKNVLLVLRNIYRLYIAIETKHYLLVVIREYRITTKLAFFIADNANNNDVALDLLVVDLDIRLLKQRLRYSCYIINLVAKAILYSYDIDCIEDALNNDDRDLSTIPGVSRFKAILRSKDELAIL